MPICNVASSAWSHRRHGRIVGMNADLRSHVIGMNADLRAIPEP
jgi:hypothetical protein